MEPRADFVSSEFCVMSESVASSDKLTSDVRDLLRAYNDVMMFAEPILLELLHDAGLTFAEIRVLRWLRSMGPLSAGELADAARIPSPSLTRVLSKLEDQGLLDRALDGKDRRRITVSITRQGEAVLGHHNNLLGGTIFWDAASALPDAIRAQLTRNLQEFRTALDNMARYTVTS
jgi:DNA-binding MarR family transcriptional regulator